MGRQVVLSLTVNFALSSAMTLRETIGLHRPQVLPVQNADGSTSLVVLVHLNKIVCSKCSGKGPLGGAACKASDFWL